MFEIPTKEAIKNIGPGIYDMSNEEYHSSLGISRSGIMTFKKSPKHFWHEYLKDGKKKQKTSAAKEFGSAFHPYILEPDLFERDFCFEDQKIDARTKEGRLYREKFSMQNQGKTILSFDQYKRLRSMVESIHSNPVSVALIDSAQYEKSFFWIDIDTGVLCKCRPDILQLGAGIICDLKSTADGETHSFRYSIKKYGYHVQAAMMIDGVSNVLGVNIEKYMFICVESAEPHLTVNLTLRNDAIDIGRQIYKEELFKFKKCLDSGEWPGYEDLQDVSLPELQYRER